MKRKIRLTALCMLLLSAATPLQSAAQDWGRLLKSGVELVQSFTVSDDQVVSYVKQFIGQSDTTNVVAADNSDYARRLESIVYGLTQVNGQPLNFKVYVTNDINAFACADGSVRVYSGLMDLMTDDEVLGVIGHEVGHVAHQDTKNAMKNALRTSALADALASTNGTVAKLTDSQLGQLGQAYLNSKYSRKQESNADDFGYDFLKAAGRNPLVLCLAFSKMQALEQDAGTQSRIAALFSTHPETSKRIADLEKKALKEGYVYPTTTSSGIPSGMLNNTEVTARLKAEAEAKAKASTTSSSKSSSSKSTKSTKSTKSSKSKSSKSKKK